MYILQVIILDRERKYSEIGGLAHYILYIFKIYQCLAIYGDGPAYKVKNE